MPKFEKGEMAIYLRTHQRVRILNVFEPPVVIRGFQGSVVPFMNYYELSDRYVAEVLLAKIPPSEPKGDLDGLEILTKGYRPDADLVTVCPKVNTEA